MPTPPVRPRSGPTGIPWGAYVRLIRLGSQTGTGLLLLPTLWSLVLAARGIPPLALLAVFVMGAFLMRSAGVVLNDLADHALDRQVARTRSRPLASGELSQSQAFRLLAILLLLAGSLILLLNPLVLRLAPIALFLATLYPFSKRWLHIPQAMLGIAFGWGTIMAWAAVREQLDPPAWLLFGATAAWAVGYDSIYALQDRDDDRLAGVRSAALYFGTSLWLAVGSAFGAMLILLAAAGWLVGIGWTYYVALLGAGIFFAVQSTRLRKPITPEQAFGMFRANVWVGVGILAGLIAGFLV
jgi:4-hydroxybenzoate polyprenyltransferase